jgi:exodeoxyribonuclease VII large subunit
MPTIATDRKVFSLLEVTRSIQKTLAKRYTNKYWVKAEMVKLNHYPQSGHCYPELIETRDGKKVAQLPGVIWKDDFGYIDRKFRQIAKQPLSDGISILFYASISFHPEHGLQLRIHNIDPTYTLGELARQRLETIGKLKADGIFQQNKFTLMPMLPHRVAVISVESSKGYRDFLSIDKNPWKYKFFHLLFPAVLQGERAVKSISGQLSRIRTVLSHFDVVAIIRGGGGDIGLTAFDNYELAKAVAEFPIPVITGIGHSTNETVCEMVAYKNAITPTDLVGYLLQKFHNFSVPVKEATEKIVDWVPSMLREESQALQNAGRLFKAGSRNLLQSHRSFVEDCLTRVRKEPLKFLADMTQGLTRNAGSIQQEVRMTIVSSREQLRARLSDLTRSSQMKLSSSSREVDTIDQRVRDMSPAEVLRRGYSITRINGRALRSQAQVHTNDILATELLDGVLTSTVTSSKPNKS